LAGDASPPASFSVPYYRSPVNNTLVGTNNHLISSILRWFPVSDNSLLLIFGTETGNAEELAEDAANMAKGFDLEATVMDMEDIEPDDISTSKRLIVVCSTWGEGEQPVNAQDLYDAVEETEEGSMEGVNFAVLALGDTAFELFCESGKEWDTILEEKGGNRVNDRIDCDTDYDDYAEEWLEATLGLMKDIS